MLAAMKQSSKRTDAFDVLFFVMIVVNNTLERDSTLYEVPKLLIALFWIAVLFLLVKSKTPAFHRSLFLPAAFFMLETLSLLWSVDVSYSMFNWSTQVQLFLLFLSVYCYMSIRKSLSLFLLATYVSGYALLLFTIVRYGISGIFTIMGNATRLGSAINNENVYGMVFACAALVAFYWVAKRRSRLHIASILLFAFFALASGSKKAIIMIVAGIVVICVLVYGTRRIWKTLLVFIFFAVALIVAMNSGLFDSAIDRLSSFLGGELDTGDLNRQIFRESGIHLILQRPFFGYGMASFAQVSGYGVYAHDNFIEIGVGTGCIGILLYYIPWVTSAVFLYRGGMKEKDGRLALFVLVVLNIVIGIASVQVVLRAPWILLAVALAMQEESKTSLHAKKGNRCQYAKREARDCP